MSHAATGGRELYVRHAKKDSRSVAILRAVDHGASCVVEAQVFSVVDGTARPRARTRSRIHARRRRS